MYGPAAMELATVHDVHMAINLAHRFIYFVPEAAEEYAALGITGRGGYLGSRSAPMGPVTEPVVLATFYNFSPAAVASGDIASVWRTASPEALQAARFRAAARAFDRVGYHPSTDQLAAARAIVDRICAAADYAGRPLAAANAAVALPDDPRVALWQQLTVIREWRGDAHIAVLVAAAVGPCECNVLQVGSGRMAKRFAGTRQWSDEDWTRAVARLHARGWVNDDESLTADGTAGREQIEEDTDRLCTQLWDGVPDEAGAQLIELIAPINDLMTAAGTYAALA